MDHIALKKKIRKEKKSARMALSPDEVASKSAAIFDRWKREFSGHSMDFLHVFVSIKKFKEVDTSPFIGWAMDPARKVSAVVPVTHFQTNSLSHLVIDKDFELVENEWGIPEPVHQNQFISPEKPDMVLVPMLAFDRDLNRIGYGKGFYDGFLASTRPDCRKIGLCFELGYSPEAIPAESHDIPLDFVITEERIYRREE